MRLLVCFFYIAMAMHVLPLCSRCLLAQDSATPGDPNAMLSLLQQMVAEDPSRADTWRLIGRIHHQQGRVPDAVNAFRHTLSLQPDNVAAHSDLGELMSQVGNSAMAEHHFNQVMSLAPNSSYAQQLVSRGIRPAPRDLTPAGMPVVSSPAGTIPNALITDDLGRNQTDGNVETVGYEIQTFDGADDLERRLLQLESEAISPRSWRAFVEFGALYNTNVSLTPISRELAGDATDGFQGLFSPDLEWTAFRHDSWRAGPLARGNFTVNEDNNRSLNLASFQPGVFLERDLQWGENSRIGRLDYVYSIDLLDGDRFADRHSVTASLVTILPNADVIYAYVTASVSDFAEDGANPSIDSLDGAAITTGVSRFFQTDWELVPTWSLGLDGEWADTKGADFRYEAITFHSDMTIQLTSALSFVPRGGIGYRRYGDFTGAVNRDELTARASARLRWQLSECFAISTLVGYDRFASDNEDFDTDRLEAGIVATFTR